MQEQSSTGTGQTGQGQEENPVTGGAGAPPSIAGKSKKRTLDKSRPTHRFGRKVAQLPRRDERIFRTNGPHSPTMNMAEYIRHFSEPDTETGCWMWKRTARVRDYGVAMMGSTDILAHRLSYHAFNGDLVDDLEVCHQCDNPTCVNPEHLFLGTHGDNMGDASEKWRMGRSKEMIDEIVRCLNEGMSYRTAAKVIGLDRHSIRDAAMRLGITLRQGVRGRSKSSSTSPLHSPICRGTSVRPSPHASPTA